MADFINLPRIKELLRIAFVNAFLHKDVEQVRIDMPDGLELRHDADSL